MEIFWSILIRKNSLLEPQEERFFEGYRRTDGKAGVRNEIWIIPTVGCVNSIATSVAAGAKEFQPDSVDAIVAFPEHLMDVLKWEMIRSTPARSPEI
ncbi:MAG: UxaA family hydrolase [Mediterraneibacter gnavus]